MESVLLINAALIGQSIQPWPWHANHWMETVLLTNAALIGHSIQPWPWHASHWMEIVLLMNRAGPTFLWPGAEKKMEPPIHHKNIRI